MQAWPAQRPGMSCRPSQTPAPPPSPRAPTEPQDTCRPCPFTEQGAQQRSASVSCSKAVIPRGDMEGSQLPGAGHEAQAGKSHWQPLRCHRHCPCQCHSQDEEEPEPQGRRPPHRSLPEAQHAARVPELGWNTALQTKPAAAPCPPPGWTQGLVSASTPKGSWSGRSGPESSSLKHAFTTERCGFRVE